MYLVSIDLSSVFDNPQACIKQVVFATLQTSVKTLKQQTSIVLFKNYLTNCSKTTVFGCTEKQQQHIPGWQKQTAAQQKSKSLLLKYVNIMTVRVQEYVLFPSPRQNTFFLRMFCQTRKWRRGNKKLNKQQQQNQLTCVLQPKVHKQLC